MRAGDFALALVRLAAVIACTGVFANSVTAAWGLVGRSTRLLCQVVLALSLLLVAAEALGLVKELRMAPLLAVLAAAAAAARVVAGRRAGPPERHADAATERHADAATERHADAATGRPTSLLSLGVLIPALAVAVVAGQWLLTDADVFGGGMTNFDTLWYHMPFAAGFALSGSVTAIHFTQADPWVAYYPANSELVHAVGIIAMHGDLLSPLLNTAWLAVALLASYCLGRPWRVQGQTLVAGCLLAGLPVLAASQPGEAFNDMPGLAMLLAGAALLVNADGDLRLLAVAGLGLGFAFGTKFTFLVPTIVIVLGAAALAPRHRRLRTLAALGLPVMVTGGWWYLRSLIYVGNPLGLRMHVGPITLPGPTSPLAAPFQQTVASQLAHFSLWTRRFAPGLHYAFGILWPLVLVLFAGALVWGVARAPDRRLRLLAVSAAAATLTYLVLPTGASNIQQSTMLFEVNLRYFTPAVALALLITPPLVALARGAPRARGGVSASALAMLVLLLAAQLNHSLWPADPARHAVFLALAVVLVASALAARALPERWHTLVIGPVRTVAVAAAAALALFAAGFVAQRHYLNRRYRLGWPADPGLGAIFSWAQRTAHDRIGLYGTLEQYPLYGDLITNTVDYLGARTADGGYQPLPTCRSWRQAVDRGHYRYLVLSPSPETNQAPLHWTVSDPAARPVLEPTPQEVVFALAGPLDPRSCGAPSLGVVLDHRGGGRGV